MYITASNFREFLSLYPIVSLLIGMNIVAFILTTAPIFPNQMIFEKTAGIHIYLANGELWRLITPIFIHLHFSHLLFNMIALFLFGPVIESFVGKGKFLVLFLGSGIFANVITFIFAPLVFVHVGASGAIFGIIGSLMILTKTRIIPHIDFKYVLIITGCAFLYSLLQKEVNLYAHIGGLIGGILLSYFLYLFKDS